MFGWETEGSLTPEGKSVNKSLSTGTGNLSPFSVQSKQIWRYGLIVFPGQPQFKLIRHLLIQDPELPSNQVVIKAEMASVTKLAKILKPGILSVTWLSSVSYKQLRERPPIHVSVGS